MGETAEAAREIRELKETVISMLPNARKEMDEIKAEFSKVVALGISKTVYVNSISGDDANTGASNSPVKTLDQALSMVPRAGYGLVMMADGEYSISKVHYLHGTRLYLQSQNIGNVTINLDVWAGECCGGLRAYSGGIVGTEMIWGLGFTLNTPDFSQLESENPDLVGLHVSGFLASHWHSHGKMCLVSCRINMHDVGFAYQNHIADYVFHGCEVVNENSTTQAGFLKAPMINCHLGIVRFTGSLHGFTALSELLPPTSQVIIG